MNLKEKSQHQLTASHSIEIENELARLMSAKEALQRRIDQIDDLLSRDANRELLADRGAYSVLFPETDRQRYHPYATTWKVGLAVATISLLPVLWAWEAAPWMGLIPVFIGGVIAYFYETKLREYLLELDVANLERRVLYEKDRAELERLSSVFLKEGHNHSQLRDL